MRGFWKIPLLAMGTLFGYGLAFHGMHHRHHEHDAWEDHFADVCARSVRRAKAERAKSDDNKGQSPAPKTESTEP